MPRYRDKNYDAILEMTNHVRNVVAIEKGHNLEVIEKGPEELWRRWKCRRCGAVLEARLDTPVEKPYGMTDFDEIDLVEKRGEKEVQLSMCFGNVDCACICSNVCEA